ncbi:MAG: Gfo/Idh/MocA family oxidoreductase [Planctomycetota bacterium]|nr:Gfo/Idh/MocA family oxidoreductase [Planctomycetota bacterium]
MAQRKPKTSASASDTQPPLDRRGFLGGALAAATAASLLRSSSSHAEEQPAPPPKAEEAGRKIKLGVVGCGGRGAWIAGLFKKHGGYEMHAVADYFQAVADKCGDALGVDKARRFSTLSGYKQLIESGIEAIAIEDVPYFYPEQAKAAVEAGLHVYTAKPVAVDVPGALQIEALAKQATQKKRCFLVDYQMPTDPSHIEVATRVRDGALGKLAQVATLACCGGFSDPPKTANLESRLQGLIWCNDTALGGGYLVNFDIHAIDAAVWVLGQRPVSVMSASRQCRANPHGDSHDVTSAVFEYADGLVHNHFGQALANNSDGVLDARLYGTKANALLTYWLGKAYVRGGDKHFAGKVENLYEAGAVRNIAAFRQNICEDRFGNEIAQRAVDGLLTAILAREAGLRRGRLTMEDLLKENKRLDVDLTGLKT